jgi:hypothetical protein
MAITSYIPDVVIHGIAGFLGSLAVVYLHAAFSRANYAVSQRKVFKHLEELAQTLPSELQVLVAKYMGYFGAFVLILVLAVGFGFLGKLIAPPLATAFKYFGDTDARLWVEQRPAIFAAEERLQVASKSSTSEWDSFQDGLGRYQVRTVRALIPFTFILFLAGVIDLVRRSKWRRGCILISIAAVSLVLTVMMWSSFQGTYVRQLRAAYRIRPGLAAFPE